MYDLVQNVSKLVAEHTEADAVLRVGVEAPTVEVQWRNLHVEANVLVGSRGLPTVINSYRNFVEVSHSLGQSTNWGRLRISLSLRPHPSTTWLVAGDVAVWLVLCQALFMQPCSYRLESQEGIGSVVGAVH